jgi:hypothetical protein
MSKTNKCRKGDEMLKFKPEDFYPTHKTPDNRPACPYMNHMDNIITLILASILAQKKFDKWLKSQPVVYGRMYQEGEGTPGARKPEIGYCWIIEKTDERHKARLVNIEEIGDE